MLMPKIRIALMILAASLAAHTATAGAQAAGANGNLPLVSKPFYKGALDGNTWVLVRDARNDGYQCAVSYVTGDGIFSIHGPLDAEMAKTGTGMLWFAGPRVPKPAEPMTRVSLAVHANDGAWTWPARQTTIGNASQGTLIVAVAIKSVLDGKVDTNDLSVSLAGNEVFHAHLVEIQKAYAQLGECMAGRS